MEIVYAVDTKMTNDDDDEFKHVSIMDISCLNILSFTCSYLSALRQLKYSPYLNSSPSDQTIAKSSCCVYICALEQPWYFSLITTSNLPIVQLVWSLDGTHLLVCDRIGLCQIFKMKNGCINIMDRIYRYETNEDILYAKYIFSREPIVIDLDRNDSLFYTDQIAQSPLLQYALNSGNFVCVTASGTIHTLPLDQSSPPWRYCLSQNEPLCVSLCDIFPTNNGFHVVLSEHIQGALVHFFVVQYASVEPKLSYTSSRARGFRIPSCYGKLQSLVYFQRHGIDCILTHMTSFSGELIDLYEYNNEQEEWISTTLLNSPQARITSISVSPNQLLIHDNEYQGLFNRQILIALSDGSMVRFDKLNLQYRKQVFPMQDHGLTVDKSEFFVGIQHTYSGLCCIGFTQNGLIILLRTIDRNHISSSSSILNILVHLFEQYIVQTPCPCDLWDILSLVPNHFIINQLIDRLVTNYESQTLELKRTHFSRFKECLYHLHRLACPYINDSGEHLTSLLVYHVLSIVRDYLRLFIYEPTNRNFVDAAQEILQQTSFVQNIDIKRILYVGDQMNTDNYQLISFTLLINWITDMIVYLLGYLQLHRTPQWFTCQNLFTDSNQLQWLRELMIYFYVLNKMNKIPCSKIACLQLYAQEQTHNTNAQKDILKDVYHSLTRYSQALEAQKSNLFDEQYLTNFSIFDIEMLQSKADSMFPSSYPFLIPNSPLPQTFIRDHPPASVTHLYETAIIHGHFSDTQFDIMTLGKMSLSSNPTFRRCLRCSNFSRVFTSKPHSFLVHRLKNRCLCGGLFLLYTQSNPSETTTINIAR